MERLRLNTAQVTVNKVNVLQVQLFVLYEVRYILQADSTAQLTYYITSLRYLYLTLVIER